VIDQLSPWKLPYDAGNASFEPSYMMSIVDWAALLQKAEDGDPDAQWEVADRFYNGCRDERGDVLVEASSEKAVEWFRKSAELGYSAAQNNLGIMLGNGDGVEKNSELALYWLKRAWRGGDPCAPKNIAITYREQGNLKRAFHWFQKCAATGDDDAVLQSGIHYFWGKGVRKDYAKAVTCFQQAIKGKDICESSRDDAHFYLALAYLDGRGVVKSVSTAKKLLKRANVDNDHPAARELLRELSKS